MVFLLKHLYDCFVQRDAEIIEINPLVLTKKGDIIAADTKVIIDDNAIYRQAQLKAEEDRSQINFRERIAHTYDLQYIYSGGDIGVLANGAGLAMATMDIIKYYGGSPANFLDLGGGASNEQIMEAMTLLEQDHEINAIFLNIFGGILKCDKLANSVIRAIEEIGMTKPIILRLKGTNSDEAMKRLKGKEQALGIYSYENLDEAAQ